MDVATGWDGGDSSRPWVEILGGIPPPRNPMLIGDFLNFAKISVFSNISIINWAKSDEKSEFGGRWFWLTWICPPSQSRSVPPFETSWRRPCLQLKQLWGPDGRVVWGAGLSSRDLQVAGSIPVATRSCDPSHHRGFGDWSYVQIWLWLDVEINKRGYERKLAVQPTRPKTPIINYLW